MIAEILRLVLAENRAFGSLLVNATLQVSSSSEAETASSSSVAQAALLPSSLCAESSAKRCPDFGDAADEVHCCASRVKPGTYFCCNERLKAEEAGLVGGLDREGRMILGCALGALAVALALLLLFCLRSPACPLHRWRRRKRQMSTYARDGGVRSQVREGPGHLSHSRSNPHYTPVAQTIPEHLQSPPKPYPEAPPPYRLASEYPAVPPGDVRLPASPAYGPPFASAPPGGRSRSAELNRLRRGRYPGPVALPPDPTSENAVNAAVEASQIPSSPSLP